VEEYKVGDRVAWTNWTKDVGSYAQYTAVPVMSANKIPDNVSFDQAAAIVVTGLTAWTMLRSGCNIQKGGQCARRTNIKTKET
jgi:NADPH:quinone reductase-like Zn-dependent oxidoreductase